MDGRQLDPKHQSRQLTEGPRARRRALVPARHRLRRRGARQADHRRRLDLDRDDALQLRPARARRQGQGGHPRRRRHADGVQHDRDLRRHHDGHVGDEDVARLAARSSPTRSSSSRAGTCSTASSRSPPATRRSPAPRWRSRGSNVPGVLLYGGSILPGRYKGQRRDDPRGLRGGRRARRGQDRPTRSCASSRRPRRPASARAAASSPPTRWRWRSRCSASRRWARRWCPAAYEDKNRVATEAGALIMDVLARGQRPRDIITREGAGERDRARSRPAAARPTACCTCSRSRARPASSSTSTTSTASPRRRRRPATSSPAAASSPRTSTRRAASRSSPSGCSTPACCTRTRRP